ncbi:tRNA dimethylallyltransferase [Gemmatimonadetes bacterium T265]|nr:tRNA dimethylallyltransferase [Gemmatimonadetes bacterium T265]
MTADSAPLRTVSAIVGPTGAGKSAIALALAERVGASIISADSRQLYRAFDVGTAKPTTGERARVPHRGVDAAEPVERWSAARWADAAEQWVADCDAAGRAPLVVGGTGFYLRALAEPLFAEPPLDPARRAALARELDALTTDTLRARVAVLDPDHAGAQRAQLLRAAEVVQLTGVPLSTWQRTAVRAPRVTLRYLVVDPGPALATRLSQRLDAMLAAGWLAEVEWLARTVPDDAAAWHATGYDVWRAHLAGSVTFAQARDRVLIDTRQYAKRQRTWFRHQLPPASVVHVDPTRTDAADVALAWWRAAPEATPGVVRPRPEPRPTRP